MQPIFPPTMKITGIDNSGSITFYLPFHDCFEKNRAKYDSKFFKTAFDLCRLYNFFYSLMFAHLFFFLQRRWFYKAEIIMLLLINFYSE